MFPEKVRGDQEADNGDNPEAGIEIGLTFIPREPLTFPKKVFLPKPIEIGVSKPLSKIPSVPFIHKRDTNIAQITCILS